MAKLTRVATVTRRRARRPQRDDSEAERKLWERLRTRRFADAKFRRDVPLGDFTADFVSRDARLVIELDGGQHHQHADHDQWRARTLERSGFRIIRFRQGDVLANIDGVLATISQMLRAPGY
ncbi:MAG: endonuclease domain-containing protein [Candidatus Binataceae bacterium]